MSPTKPRRRRRNYDRPPKYSEYPAIPADPKPDAPPKLSKADDKRLETMVRKVGLAAVIEAGKKVGPPRKAGRPHLTPAQVEQAYLERINRADWIEDEAAECRERRSKKPYTEARVAALEMLFTQEEVEEVSAATLKTIKKKHLQGRRELLQMIEDYKAAPFGHRKEPPAWAARFIDVTPWTGKARKPAKKARRKAGP
jgi:hypothetical protein